MRAGARTNAAQCPDSEAAWQQVAAIRGGMATGILTVNATDPKTESNKFVTFVPGRSGPQMETRRQLSRGRLRLAPTDFATGSRHDEPPHQAMPAPRPHWSGSTAPTPRGRRSDGISAETARGEVMLVDRLPATLLHESRPPACLGSTRDLVQVGPPAPAPIKR
jgi:hypothetical protein